MIINVSHHTFVFPAGINTRARNIRMFANYQLTTAEIALFTGSKIHLKYDRYADGPVND